MDKKQELLNQSQDKIFNGYTINLFQDEDGDWLACLAEMPSASAFSDSPQAALTELEIVWQGAKESCRKHGDPIPIIEKVYAKS